VLITGGAGMIGSTIAHLAVAQGAQVSILDAMLPLYGGNRFNLRGILDEVRFIEGDIRDLDLMRRVVPGCDYIFSLAGQVSYVDSNTEPLLDLDINCKGHLQVLEACRRENPQAKLLFASSRFVYGRIEYNPVDENHPFNCLSIYGIHKLAGEKYYRFYHEAYGLKTVSVRIANPYGPRQQMKHSKYGIVNWFIRLALDGQPLTVFGDGQQHRDYIYNKDLAEGCIALMLSPETEGQVYNLAAAPRCRLSRWRAWWRRRCPVPNCGRWRGPRIGISSKPGIISAISPGSPRPRAGGPKPPTRTGLNAPWLIIVNIRKNTGSRAR